MLKVSERRACRALGQHRSTQRKAPRGRDDEEQLTADLIELARQYGRYGYRKISALLRDAGWLVNDKRVERIWRREGLKVPQKQPKRSRLWLADGSCIRLRPEYRNGGVMDERPEACPACRGTVLIRSGHACGRQRWKCKGPGCGRQFTRTTPRGMPMEVKPCRWR